MNLPHHIKQLCALAALSSIALASGCAASGPLFGTKAELAADSAEIVVYRIDRFRGSVGSRRVFVDGEQVGSVRNASWIAIKVRTGEHFLELDRGNWAGTKVNLKVSLGPGEQRLVSIQPVDDAPGSIAFLATGAVAVFGPWMLAEIERSQGLKELRDLHESK